VTRARGPIVGVLCAALAATTVARPAAALVDPSRAQSDVDASMRHGDYAFCRAPREPLSSQALALCPHAARIPGCEGFAAACARREPRRWAFEPPPWLSAVAGAVIGAAAWLVRWVLLPGLCLALLVPALRALARRRREAPADEVLPDRTVTAEAEARRAPGLDDHALMARADEHARRGAFDRAIELYLAASLAALDRRGAVHLSGDRTNGEYVRACTEAEARPGLRDLAAAVDRVKFGGLPATAEGVERAGALARAIVRTAALAAGLISLLACAGCTGSPWPGLPGRGDDPAGEEVLVDLLHRQGFGVEPLGGALSSLPMPGPGDRAPAVVVDLERTEVDEETDAHLLEWVSAGGSLVLSGAPWAWPRELGAEYVAVSGPREVEARRLLSRPDPDTTPADDDGEGEDAGDDPPPALGGPLYATATEHGTLAGGSGLRPPADAETIAWLDGGTAYAAAVPHGAGWVLLVASSELLTNAGLARPGNAAAALAILSNADREEIAIAHPEDGVAPPASPFAALERAGLGLGVAHALGAALLLFLAAGARLARPDPEPPAARRAFVEHVEAVGELYRRGDHAAHALAAFTRFAEQRLRARSARGAADVPFLLAARARLPLDVCRRLWSRATAANPAAPAGDELGILKELAAVYSLAADQER
jgi:hypothetical protein